LSASIAVIDASGLILVVDRAWRDFGASNLGDPASACKGAYFLPIWEFAREPEVAQAAEIADALRAMIRGERLHEQAGRLGGAGQGG